MTGGGWLGYAQDLDKVADAHFAFTQKVQDTKSYRVAERPKHFVNSFGIHIRISEYIKLGSRCQGEGVQNIREDLMFRHCIIRVRRLDVFRLVNSRDLTQ